MQIDVVWFPKEGPGGDTFTENIFKGPLARMTREALDYIRRNYINEIVIKHPDRAEATRVENVPFPAIEEAVVNAVYHRGYDIREPIEVRIMYDEAVVISYPGPDRSVKLDDLRRGKAMPRRYRNRRIGEFLKELELTEGRGTGIPKIIRTMRENGSPEPVFEFDEDYSYFMVRLPVHGEALKEVEDVGLDAREQVTPQVTPQVTRLMRTCTHDMLREELQELMNITDRKYLRNSFLRPAIDAGLVEMTQPDSPKSPTQKYRLTEKGKAVLRQLPNSAAGNAGADGK